MQIPLLPQLQTVVVAAAAAAAAVAAAVAIGDRGLVFVPQIKLHSSCKNYVLAS